MVDAFTTLEEAQVGLSLVGLACSCYALADSAKTMRHVSEAHVVNGRRTVAVGHVVGEFIRLLLQCAILLTATVSLCELPTPPATLPAAVLVWLGVRKTGVLVATTLLLFSTLWDLHVRHLLRRP